VLDDCGHSPHLEHPEEFQAIVSAFLARVGQR
jgi:pimeloyl-ACP methyl ester carboxylesterase